ncbi:MAG: DNA helicase PcrA [Lactobacillaceae bacterium]|jgi:DNA helicase-2/ATP-dependent DNA helicase PcrA|nr:DNA helicase PcrA [Lactobacillaceae bacterium]
MTTSILEKLNKVQQQAVVTTEGPLLIMAGAGSGKTRVLTHRIAYLIQEKNINPWSILAITFTNKAANEMRERLEKLIDYNDAKAVWVSTFHSLALRILRRDAQRIGFNSSFSVVDTSAQNTLIKHILNDKNIDKESLDPKTVLNSISRFKNEMKTPMEAKSQAAGVENKILIAEVYEEYQNRLKQNQSMDFDDLINNAILLLEKNPDISEYYQRKFRYIHVDEYQDTNDSQYRLVNLLAAGQFGSYNLAVVGDSDQSIYGWRGANISNILNFEKDFKNAQTIMLEQNYRSTKVILDAANQVIVNNKNRIEKNLWTNNDSGELITYYRAGDEKDEAFFVASQISKFHQEQGRPLSDFAILFRTNAQSRVFENQFNRMQIPYTIVGGTKFFNRKEIQDVLAYLKLISNPDDDSAFERIINEPKRSIGDTSVEKLRLFAVSLNMSMYKSIDYLNDSSNFNNATIKKFQEFQNLIDSLIGQSEFLDITELTKILFEKTHIVTQYEDKKDLESQSRVDNLNEFLSLTSEFDKNYSEDDSETQNKLVDFLGTTSLSSDIEDMQENTNDVVTLMTMHSAKGLEFPIVFIVGVEEQIFPSARALMESEEQLEEERRLAYVGITRAQEKLYLTNAIGRLFYGRIQNNPESRFVTEINADLIEQIRGQRTIYSEHTHITTPFDSTNTNSVKYSPKTTTGAEKEKWTIGQKVEHKKWGIGTVTNIKGEGPDMELTIAFPSQGIKNLLAQFAPIVKVEK